MFRFFKRRNDKPSLMYPVFQQLSGFIRQKQQKYADWLQAHTRHYSRTTLTVLLAIFCLLFGGSSVCIILGVLQGHQSTISVQEISIPSVVTDMDTTTRKQIPILTDKSYQHIQRFKRHMDSLYKNAPAVFDSMMKERPGLIDSLMFIESIYQQQLKSK